MVLQGLEIKFRLYPRFWFLTTLNNIPFVNTNLRLKKCVRLWMVVKAELSTTPVAKFKEFERRFKFKPRFKFGWFHLNCIKCFKI